MPNVYVIVWENNMYGNKKVKGHTWPGHSSINLGDYFDFPRDIYDGVMGIKNYVSWFPSEGSDFGFKTIFAKKQLGSPNSSLVDDISSEGYYPDHVIRLAVTDEALAKMKSEWESLRLKATGASYKAFRKNCSTIVSRILHAGGFAKLKWYVECNFVWSPADILRLAVGVGGVQMSWDDFMQHIKASCPKASPNRYNLTDRKGRKIEWARDRFFCSTGSACRFNNGKPVV